MAWDTLQPTNTTKIRNLGVVIRPNWAAIQTADSSFTPDGLNFKNRTTATVPIDPAAIATAYIAYCKESAAGFPELYGVDASSNIVQLTEQGRMGGPSTNVTLNNFKFGTDATTYTRNNIVYAYGRFTSAGGTVIANNCSIVRLSTGLYRVTLNPVATNTLYVPIATAFDEGNSRCCKINVLSASQFTIRIVNDDGTDRDTGGFFHVVGGF